MGNGKCLDLSFAATASDASEGIALLSLELTAQGLPKDRAADVKIALAEAINNVVEHAYSGITPAKIKVKCQLQKDWLEILIWDTGKPMPGNKLPDATPPEFGDCTDALPEGGFGWFLIHQLTSQICYQRLEGFNRLSLRFDLSATAT